MGVSIGEADGEYVCLLECGECGKRYETDETRSNDCPECYRIQFEILDGYNSDPELSWRDDAE